MKYIQADDLSQLENKREHFYIIILIITSTRKMC